MLRMVATAPPTNRKAILTTDSDATADHFEFSGAKVADKNGAGIRYEADNLTVTNSYFHDNEDGLLAAANALGTITRARPRQHVERPSHSADTMAEQTSGAAPRRRRGRFRQPGPR